MNPFGRFPGAGVLGRLRVRLALGYAVFFSLLLAGIGLFFRGMLSSVLNNSARAIVEEEWASLRGYLRSERGGPQWYYDRQDPEEAATVERLRRVLLLTDDDGNVLEVSGGYRLLGVESPEEIRSVLKSPAPRWTERVSSLGQPYLLRSGLLVDERHRYYLSIGRPVGEYARIVKDFSFRYFALLPFMILTGSLFGWIAAGRGLRPVIELAEAAERISSSNLSLRIPPRGTGDEVDHLIATFNRMMARLEDSFEQIRQFSTDVSHELRTPLTAIRGQLEVALFTARNEEQYREAITNSLEDVERLSQIVRALLLLSQAESGRLALHKTVLDMSALVRDIVDQFQIPAEGAGLSLAAELPAECPIRADRVQMERLVSNLLSNAVKYTPAGGSVSVRLLGASEQLRLEVEDTGPGIAAAHLPHIFDRFYRVRGAETSPDAGLGLGLSFVAWIVKAHGGRIDVRSEPGRGTAFIVTLPS